MNGNKEVYSLNNSKIELKLYQPFVSTIVAPDLGKIEKVNTGEITNIGRAKGAFQSKDVDMVR